MKEGKFGFFSPMKGKERPLRVYAACTPFMQLLESFHHREFYVEFKV
jgi:hypothetical protein